MPAATTHVEMAKDVLRTTPELEYVISNKQMFFLGSQGPDLLFFNRASILPGTTKPYGNLMHVSKVKEVIAYFERYTKTNPSLKSYFLGYLCHYCLDSMAHPLVYGVSHALHKDGGASEGEIHVALESDIDVWILSQRARSIEDYDVYNYLKVSHEDRNMLAEMYHNMFKDIFHIDLSENHLRRSIDDVSLYTRVLAPNKLKTTLFYTIEKIIMKGSHAITAMMLSEDKQPQTILNLDHKTYTMPWDENETINLSFPELYGKAVLKAQRILFQHSEDDFILNFCGTTKKVED